MIYKVLLAGTLIGFFYSLVFAGDQINARIAIVIDDLGNQLKQGRRVVNLPGKVTIGVLPGRPFSQRLAAEAYCSGKEIILHMPMQAEQNNNMGAYALHQNMVESDFILAITQAIESLPNIVGLNNHMGSFLTQQPLQMSWLMDAMKNQHLHYYLDSKTTNRSIALSVAAENGVPAIGRDVFLDTDRNIDAITQQFNQLLKIAKKRGHAVAIGHPYHETLAVLEEKLPLLSQLKIALVPLGNLIDHSGVNHLHFFQDIPQ